ncbi:hypothetical protein ACFE04_006851 [Oxalis oulophora]
MDQVRMMMINSREDISWSEKSLIFEDLIKPSTCHSWKLYENPFYNPHFHLQKQVKHQCNEQKKFAAAFFNLTFFRSVMETELELARVQMVELKTELELERKARKKAETICKKLANELGEEKKGREAIDRVCEQLAKKISSRQGEIDRMKKEMEEERKMLRIVELLREERVQMKLSEAKILFEEKLLKLGEEKLADQIPDRNQFEEERIANKDTFDPDCVSNKISRMDVIGERSLSSREQAENPHIKRGIKGHIEFPRVVKAIGSKASTKLECQKSQLKILLKQKSPIRSNALILS